jgi:predicted O-methyltransferase YrrM
VAFDPMQDQWGDQGLVNLARAGHDERFEFVRRPAHVGLALFEEAGRRAQLAFVDGWHTFDHTLVDLFHVDRVLDVGGVVALDDLNVPAVAAAYAYVTTNRAYEPVAYWPAPGRRRRRAPVPDGVRCVALRKTGEDTREWDAHVPFWSG